ncbi:MAG: alpha-mannosidase [Armatimonadota bacterium]
MDVSLYNQTIGIMDEKLGAFKGAGALSNWYYRMGEAEDAFSENIDTNDWTVVNGGYSWSSGAGSAWFRKEIEVPQAVNDVSTEGSIVELVFMLPIGATVYLNGVNIYEEPFWADTRPIPIILTENYKSGDKLSVVIKAKSGDGFGLFCGAWLRIDNLEKVAFDLEIAREQIKFCNYLMGKEKDAAAKSKQDAALQDALTAVDVESLRANKWDDFAASMTKVVEKLMIFNDEAKSYEVKLIAHSHIDMNWLWTWQETVDVCYRDFTTMDKLMANYPDFYFSQSQASTYKAIEDYHPEVFKKIQERVKEGKWDITASTWVEGDLNTAMAETLSRQILHTRRYIGDKFGVTPKICWEPDTFGHIATYPQILKKSGVEYYYHCRAGKGHPIYWWESPDGSRVLALNDMTGYGGEIDPTSLTYSVSIFADRYDLKTSIWVYGAGDHGGGATARDIERGICVNNTPLLPSTCMSTTIDFYEAVKNAGIEYPVVKDELNTTFEGCYTSHTDIKWLNRYGENSLLTSETLAAFAALEAGYAYPFDTLIEAWQNQSFHQFHDILCGCAIGSTYQQAADALKPSHDALAKIVSDSVKKLASNVDTGNAGKIVVFNQLAWNRTDVVEVPVSSLNVSADDIASSYLVDEAGNKLPVQLSGDMAVFIAKDVPSLGCKTYEIVKGDTAGLSTLQVHPNNVLENEFFKAQVNPRSGAIDSLILKSLNRELVAQTPWGEAKINAGMLNRFSLYFEEPHSMSAWTIGDITHIDNLISGAEVKVGETGAVFADVAVKQKFLNSSLEQKIRVYNGLDRIDFLTEVDWHEKGTGTTDAPMLKVTFTPDFGASKAVYEIPYGTIERPANGNEVPALRWADLSEAECGISLMNNCKYGHHAQGNTLALTLIRSSYEPDNNPDERLHKFTYSICPHKGSWQDAGTQFKGAELNQPLIAVAEGGHSGSMKPGKAYITCAPENVAVSAVKLAEDQPAEGTALVVRLFEGFGKETKAKLDFGWQVTKAEEINIIEEFDAPLTVKDNSLELDLGAHEIKTIKLYIK